MGRLRRAVGHGRLGAAPPSLRVLPLEPVTVDAGRGRPALIIGRARSDAGVLTTES